MFFKIDVLKNFAIFMEKHLYWSLFFNKVADLEARKVFSCEYCDIFKSDFFHRSLPVDTSQNISDSDAPRCSIKKNS